MKRLLGYVSCYQSLLIWFVLKSVSPSCWNSKLQIFSLTNKLAIEELTQMSAGEAELGSLLHKVQFLQLHFKI